MALDNFKIHYDEWQTKRKAAKNYQDEVKPEKLPVVRSEKKPTISTGESVPVNKTEKSNGKVSDMLKELAVSPELKTAETEKIDQTAAENSAGNRTSNCPDNFVICGKTVCKY